MGIKKEDIEAVVVNVKYHMLMWENNVFINIQ